MFSDEPRRKENLANAAEMEIFKKFEADPSRQELVHNDGQLITTYRPVRISKAQGCLSCHGDPRTSPWKNGKDILGIKMENWTDGKLHGVFAVTQNIQAVAAAASAGQVITPAGWLIGAIMLGALVAGIFAAIMAQGPVNALNLVASTLAASSTKVNSASQQIAASAQHLAEANFKQAAALQETAASIEEMSAMVERNSENARGTARSSAESSTKAELGQRVVGQMLQSMQDINLSNANIMNQINNSNAQMTDIVKVIQEIGSKTQVINDIVFQTKLLSFNASVEAARAGEHGKGFAVVAEEVGNLAQMSGNAAKEISFLLEGSLQKVESIVQETKVKVEGLISEGKKKVDAGTAVANQCSEVLTEIVQNVGAVAQMASEISIASQEQSTGVHELTKAMNQIDQVTQQISLTSESSARSADELSGQAGELNAAVVQLIGTIRGAGNAAVDNQQQESNQTTSTDQIRSITEIESNAIGRAASGD